MTGGPPRAGGESAGYLRSALSGVIEPGRGRLKTEGACDVLGGDEDPEADGSEAESLRDLARGLVPG